MAEVTEMLAALILEAPDILCEYAGRTNGFDTAVTGIRAGHSQKRTYRSALALWLEVGRAVALVGILDGGGIRFGRRLTVRSGRWCQSGLGRIDMNKSAREQASGFSRGIPVFLKQRVAPTPEMLLFRAALRAAAHALNTVLAAPGRIAAAVRETASTCLLRLRDFPLPDIRRPGPEPEVSQMSISVLDRWQRGNFAVDDACKRIAEIYRFSGRRAALAASPDPDFELHTAGGADFEDKLFELLCLARLRAWVETAATGLVWFPGRILGSGGEPVMTATAGSSPVRVWFQSGGGLTARNWMITEPVRGRIRGIPDIVVSVGKPGTARTLLIDSKNYAGTSPSSDAFYKMLGYKEVFGLSPFLALVIRPGGAGENRAYASGGSPDDAVRIAGMEPGPSGSASFSAAMDAFATRLGVAKAVSQDSERTEE